MSASISFAADQLLYDRDIRPILAENCFYCHGTDESQRQSGLRLDRRSEAIQHGAVVPGRPQESLVVERISSSDPDLRMPPAGSHRKLTKEQITVLTQWIADGAKYESLWSLEPIARPPAPNVDSDWVRGQIDQFVIQRLRSAGLQPNLRAPARTLMRRLSLDITGLPPTEDQVKHWQAAEDPIRKAIEELLDSPAYGERMASEWLDVARYADTHGFNNDSLRSMWPWRDWVVNSFNRNQPYDRFVIEQLAGDLLPASTLDQRIATGFNRNHPINSEGGIIDEEYRVEYVADRVRTTSLAWLGLTLECARCHDHKYDPIAQQEYYQFAAFFNSMEEWGEDGRVANAAPFIYAPDEKQREQYARLLESEAQLERELERIRDENSGTHQSVVNGASSVVPPRDSRLANQFANSTALDLFDTPTDFLLPEPLEVTVETVDTSKGWAWSSWINLYRRGAQPLLSTMNYAIPTSSRDHGQGIEIRITESGAVELRVANRWPAYSTNVFTVERLPLQQWTHVALVAEGTNAKTVRVFLNGVEVELAPVHDGQLSPVMLAGRVRLGWSNSKKCKTLCGKMQHFMLWQGPVDAASFRELLMEENDCGQGDVAASEFREARSRWIAAREARLACRRSFPTVMVAREIDPPRPTFVLERGVYDQHGEVVTADVPAMVGLSLEGFPRNRLGLAKWFTDRRNPLTARVVMNRLWQQLFGIGIVETANDFGSQSEWPSHPELLDWLAAEFIESGWDMKHMVRLIVESATYQQDSGGDAESWTSDPDNRLLRRGPRQRLTAEMIRDQALALSGLLNRRQGGPPVYPYQPKGFYKGTVVEAGYPGTTYVVSHGGDLYRRSLYMFWKRTVLHPTLATFDAPDRETCTARRLVTNTPLQALALMNDPTFTEAARMLGERMLSEGGVTDTERVAWGFARVTGRNPEQSELRLLLDLLESQRHDFAEGRSTTESVLNVGEATVNSFMERSELAAYASLGRLLLNLDETITRN